MRDSEAYVDFCNERSFEEYQIEFRRKKVLEIIEKLKPRKILEIGCGTEPIFKYLKTDSYDRMIIVEPVFEYCENARKLANGDAKIQVIQNFFEHCTEDVNEEIDFILCSGCLPEIKEPKELFTAIKKVCIKSKDRHTVAHLNVTNANSIHRLLAIEMGILDDPHTMTERNFLFQQYRIYDRESLRKQVEEVGFTVAEEGSYFVKFFPHSMMMEMMDKNIITYEMLEGMYKLEKYLPEYGSEIYVNIML